MTTQEKFENFKKEIDILKNRQIRGEEQLKIANEKFNLTKKTLLEMTGKETVQEAILYVEERKKSLFTRKEILNKEYSLFLENIGEL